MSSFYQTEKTCLLEFLLCAYLVQVDAVVKMSQPILYPWKLGWKPPSSFTELIRERIVLIYPGKLNMSQIQALLKSQDVIATLLEFLETSETTERVQGLSRAQVLLSRCRKNSARGRVTGKERVYQHRTLVRFTSRQARECHPKNLVGYSCIIKGRMGRGRRPPSSSFLSRCHASIISSSSTSGGGVFSCPYVVKLGLSWHSGNEQKGSNIY